MPLTPHPAFARMATAFLDAFGSEAVSFAGDGGETLTTMAIVRLESQVDAFSESAGAATDRLTVRLATSDAAQMVEGWRFSHSGLEWKLVGERQDDGRGMSSFEGERYFA